jgi:FkbM family methyltransferase
MNIIDQLIKVFHLQKKLDRAASDVKFSELYYQLYGDCLTKDTLIETIRSECSPESVIFDVGANSGSYSIYLAYHIGNSRVYSFEPVPENFNLICNSQKIFAGHNIGLNITAKNIAISDKVEKRSFLVSSDLARSSFHESNALSNNSKIDHILAVEGYSIDYLIEKDLCPLPDVLKIDTEGHEYEVLKGAERTISRRKPKIFYEPHGVTDIISDQIISNEGKIRDFLSMYGYHFKSLGYPIFCYV